MDPLDYRNAQFTDLQERLQGLRNDVLEAFRKHGPGTTREISLLAGIDILTLRPRTTELLQLGCLEMIEDEDEKEDEHEDDLTQPKRRTHEGRYRALTSGEIHEAFFSAKAAAQDKQLPLKI